MLYCTWQTGQCKHNILYALGEPKICELPLLQWSEMELAKCLKDCLCFNHLSSPKQNLQNSCGLKSAVTWRGNMKNPGPSLKKSWEPDPLQPGPSGAAVSEAEGGTSHKRRGDWPGCAGCGCTLPGSQWETWTPGPGIHLLLTTVACMYIWQWGHSRGTSQ